MHIPYNAHFKKFVLLKTVFKHFIQNTNLHYTTLGH